MKQKLIFAAVVVGFVALALIGRERAPDTQITAAPSPEAGTNSAPTTFAESKSQRKRKRGKRNRERREISTPENPRPTGRFTEENEERRNSNEYKHARHAGNDWLALANQLQTDGHAELSEDARFLSRFFKRARRPDADQSNWATLIGKEVELVERVRTTPFTLSADAEEILQKREASLELCECVVDGEVVIPPAQNATTQAP